MRRNRVPIVEFSRTDYTINCPKCNKPITLSELEYSDECICGTYWNKYALTLIPFYNIHSEKLLRELEEFHDI